jgi:Protein of unknown function (DUF2752)
MNPKDPHGGSIKQEWSLRIAVSVALLFFLWVLLLHYEPLIRDLSPGCFFKRVTGLNCAGCGGTRAFFAFLKGEFALSLRMNPLFLIGLVGGIFFGLMMVRDKLPGGGAIFLRYVRVTAGLGWGFLGVLVAFWVLRNLPWWPFTLLAPP